MHKNSNFCTKRGKKDVIIAETRQRPGISQAIFVKLSGGSRPFLILAEGKERNLPPGARQLITTMYVQFMELETGVQANYRSLETRLLLNDGYKTVIPAMKAQEKECRLNITRLTEELRGMKQREKNAENAIIVCTTMLKELQEKGETDAATQRLIKGWKLFKEGAYQQLTGCRAPAQVTLQAKIEALRAEARVLRRARLMIMREHHPFKQISAGFFSDPPSAWY